MGKFRNPDRKASNAARSPAEGHFQDKQAAVLGRPKTAWRRRPLVAVGLAVALLAGAAVWRILPSPPVDRDAPPVADADGGRMRHPLHLFDNGQARHFEYRDGDLTIRYFVVRSTDGVIRAAFDACDVCWPAGKGYVQEGNSMVCRNCGRRFESVRVNEVQGGCNPAPLNRRIEGDAVIIEARDLREGRGYFDFSRKA